MDFNNTSSNISKKKLYFWVGGVAAVTLVGLVGNRLLSRSIDISNLTSEVEAKVKKTPIRRPADVLVTSALSGVKCATGQNRPMAVMLSSDAEARPLSGIGEADMVFEMPVVDVGFTRMMAVFQCGLSADKTGRPREVGSVRSSRLDFVPLVLGLNAIYAHFGGEHTVLAELNAGIIDNIDGLKYDGTYYYRKKGIPRPHNSFTNFDLLNKIAVKLGYGLDGATVSYPHENSSRSVGTVQPPTIFNEKFAVSWRYDKSSNSYFRTRSGQAEIDKNTSQPVSAKNVVILKTTWSPINKDYIRVKTIGAGGLLLYKNGTVVTGTWEKPDDKAKLTFYDQNHKEIPLAVGRTWVEVDAH